MKKKLIIILTVIIVLLGIGIYIYSRDNLRFKISYESINNIEYTNGKKIPVSIPIDNGVKYLTGNKIKEVMTKETGIFYFGYTSCPWCRNAVVPLIETAKENGISKIYYIDTHSSSFQDVSTDVKEVLGDYLETDEETGQKRLGVPDVYFVKDGEIIGHHIGTVSSYKNPYLGMNKQQTNELKEIYRIFIKEIK
ncbi:MAG: hypothetical protein E7168_00780 [Firmicutes bacterium]|nr:hypothetical protein [Bacillota bacterium]